MKTSRTRVFMLILVVVGYAGLVASFLSGQGSQLALIFAIVGAVCVFPTWLMGLFLSARAKRWGWFVCDLLLAGVALPLHALVGPVKPAENAADRYYRDWLRPSLSGSAGLNSGSFFGQNVQVLDFRDAEERNIEARAAAPLDAENEAIARRLLPLLRTWSAEYNASEAFKQAKADIEEIGWQLCRNGGNQRMQLIAYRVKALSGSLRTLESVWGHADICGWQP